MLNLPISWKFETNIFLRFSHIFTTHRPFVYFKKQFHNLVKRCCPMALLVLSMCNYSNCYDESFDVTVRVYTTTYTTHRMISRCWKKNPKGGASSAWRILTAYTEAPPIVDLWKSILRLWYFNYFKSPLSSIIFVISYLAYLFFKK